MVVAFYLVALAMVAGGLAAIYFGSDIIMVERGWTMVIAGTVAAAGGALLAGLATVVSQLRGLHDEFARMRERLIRLDAPFPQPPSALPDLGRTAAPPVMPPAPSRAGEMGSAPELGGVLRDGVLGALADADRKPQPGGGERPGSPHRGEAPRHEPAPPQPGGGRTVVLQERGPSAAEPAAEDADAASVVGTYSSGGNFYIMYSDGSIAAETPAGTFRFGSLDELKEFIAAGGDRPKASNRA